MKFKTRKGLGGGRGKGTLKNLLEGSTIVDLLTLGALSLNFVILKNSGSGYGSSNLFQVPSNMQMLSAQLTGLVIAIYVIEAVIDSSGARHA